MYTVTVYKPVDGQSPTATLAALNGSLPGFQAARLEQLTNKPDRRTFAVSFRHCRTRLGARFCAWRKRRSGYAVTTRKGEGW